MSRFSKAFEIHFQMFTLEHIAPLIHELLTIKNLEVLKAFRCVAAGGSAFVMHHPRHGLINNLKPEQPDTETKIDVFVISGREATIESAQSLKNILSDQQRGCGTVIHFAREIEAPVIRRAAPAIMMRLSVFPNDRAGLLD